MSVRLETTYGGTRWENTRMVDTKDTSIDADIGQCCKEIYCSPCKTTSGKVARLVVCAGTGAALGAFGGPPGAAIGGTVGLTFGFCSIL